jgi:hypothetical protein
MIEALAKIISLLAKHAWQVFIICLVIILTPDHLFKVKSVSIKADYIGLLWMTLVFSGVFMAGNLASVIHKAKSMNQKKNGIIQKLKFLDYFEQCWIVYLLMKNVQTICTDRSNPTANSLMSKGILYVGSGHVLDYPFHIEDFVWCHLKDNEKFYLEIFAKSNPEGIMIRFVEENIISLKDYRYDDGSFYGP